MKRRTANQPAFSALLWACLTLAGCPADEQVTAEPKDSMASPDSDGDPDAASSRPDTAPDQGVVDGAVQPDADEPDSGAPQTPWHEDCPADALEQRMMNVGQVRLNVACRGAGPTIVLLHGFPEFHYGWHKVMDALADEYRLVAPDQRGYNLSDKPEAVADYHVNALTEDIVNLLPLISPDPVLLVAHDWGGPVGWLVAHTPDAHIRGFVATNGPHPVRFIQLITHDPAQRTASQYMEFFRSPAAEAAFTVEQLSADFDFLEPEALARYQAAWAQPGAITGGLNWYRANLLQEEDIEGFMAGRTPTVPVPTVVMWGLDDAYVLPSNAADLEEWVPNLDVQLFEGVDHWVAHRIPEQVAQVLRQLDADTAPEKP